MDFPRLCGCLAPSSAVVERSNDDDEFLVSKKGFVNMRVIGAVAAEVISRGDPPMLYVSQKSQKNITDRKTSFGGSSPELRDGALFTPSLSNYTRRLN